jgi:hypothetical protein
MKWRARLHEIIFEADTRAGRAFDFAPPARALLQRFANIAGRICRVIFAASEAFRPHRPARMPALLPNSVVIQNL